MTDTDTYLTGKLLIAMPGMPDPRFAETVIYMCVHSGEGAMGLVINKLVESIDFAELVGQLDLETGEERHDVPVHLGGPVESGRGFVLHSRDYSCSGTMEVAGELALSASVEILQEICLGGGPSKFLLALGYSGWGPGQLEHEIQENGWLSVESDDSLLFATDTGARWRAALAKIGIDPVQLTSHFGRA